MDYTTLSGFRTFGDFVSTDDDGLLTDLITQASRIMDKYCGHILVTDVETNRTFRKLSLPHITPDSFEGRILYFDTDLAEEAAAITGDPVVTYLPENIPPFHGVVLEEGSWENPTVVSGYWAKYTSIPADINFACNSLTKWLYEMRETTRGDMVVVTPEGQTLVPRGLPTDVTVMLQPYTRIGLGI